MTLRYKNDLLEAGRCFMKVEKGLDDVLDVGGVYDPSRDRYDGHQNGFGEVFCLLDMDSLPSFAVQALFIRKYNCLLDKRTAHEASGSLETLHTMLGWCYVESWVGMAIDAINNGINHYDMDQPPRYVKNTHNVFRVGRLYLNWTDPDQSHKKENEAFERAMAITGNEIA
uniref:Uncharacterized protein n=1 Tax=Salix viminalis TaxID=40686 RepID=A0A6N2M3Y1_SALVM